VSTIDTVNVQLLELPRLSLAVQVTLLCPRENPDPLGGVQMTGSGLPAESSAVTVKLAGVSTPVYSATSLSGQPRTGGGSGVIVICTAAEEVLPCRSRIV
jgi:hypothetical protein